MRKLLFNWKWTISDLTFLILLFLMTFSLSSQKSISYSLIFVVCLVVSMTMVAAFLTQLYKKDVHSLSASRLLFCTLSMSTIAGATQLLLGTPVETVTLSVLVLICYLLITRISYQYKVRGESRLVNIASEQKKRLLIIGAGEAGRLFADRLRHKKQYDIAGFVDDDYKKIGLEIGSIPVLSEIKLLKSTALKFQVDQLVVAIPSLNREKLRQIMQLCIETGLKTQVIPSIEDLVNGKPIHQTRDVHIDDLLGREEVALDETKLRETVTNKVVLVTGAGGSIGSEICRQLIRLQPKKLILLGHGENSIYLIERELRGLTSIPLQCIIADIRDADAIEQVMYTHRPEIVYHAAAHKHVPLMEQNPYDSIKNNIFGTRHVAQAAHKAGVERFVMISSDKAVDPPNIMGATKRVAEMIIQQVAKQSDTKFAVVRFGNVLGSRGSVIPLFQQQIANGGPITLTDKRMTRYFMTIPEAARLVLQASSLTEGGEIFILDMGKPVKIIDLAQNLIRLSGHELEDIPIVETGIREGEKLHETLLGEQEQLLHKVFNKIYVGATQSCTQQELDEFLAVILQTPVEDIKGKLLSFANQRQRVVAESRG